MATPKAALYLRSSKDRSDVSIDAQRRELTKLAQDRGILIVHEYSDVVESAKDENRPGFQQLLLALRSPRRSWNTLLLVDTSRLSRRRYMAQVFKHEAKKRGVHILYSKIPESDPIADMVLVGVMEVFDELHSLMSKEKGLAGMAENVRQGYRAGGRAPRGYKLDYTETGSVREGIPVTKSKLIKGDDAKLVAKYMKQRAAGISRTVAAAKMAIVWPQTSLIGMEWNALTYAGHTVWNVHNEHGPGGYKGGIKRRPRAEWVIQNDTHPALITTAEAERIIHQLTTSSRGTTRRTPATYLLTGILKSPDGAQWHGDGAGKYYRAGKGKKVRSTEVDQAVIAKVADDLKSPAFVTALVKQARKQQEPEEVKDLKAASKHIEAINAKIAKMVNLAGQMTTPAPVLRKIEELELERGRTVAEMEKLERQADSARVLAFVTEADVKKMLDAMAADMTHIDRESLKDFLAGLIERIDLDPSNLSCSIHYNIPVKRGDRMASPRGFDAIPSLRAVRRVAYG